MNSRGADIKNLLTSVYRALVDAFSRRSVRLMVSLFFIGVLLYIVDLEAFFERIQNLDLAIALLALMLFVPDRLFSSYRWYLLMRIRNPELRFLGVLRVVLVSSFYGFFLPGQVGGEILRIYGVRVMNVDLAEAFSSVFIERIFALLGLIVVMLLGLSHASIALPDGFGLVMLVFAIGILLAVGIIASGRLRAAIKSRLPKRAGGFLTSKLERFFQVLDDYNSRRDILLTSLGLGILFQLFRLAHVYVFALALFIDVDIFTIFALIPVVRLIAMVPISIAGIGLREAGYVVLFGSVGVAAEAALALSTLVFASTILANLPGAFLLQDVKAASEDAALADGKRQG